MDNSDYIIRVIDLPCRINAFTALDGEGLYNIYINDKLDPAQKEKALRHELAHINGEHFYLDIPLRLKEYYAEKRS